MLIRRDERGLLLITQPAHAWVAGQIARAWGNELFGAVDPREEVVLAATLHDIGWLAWEAAPSLNAETGLPHTFLELPIEQHLRIWDVAATSALAFGPFPALFTSLHGTGLYERRRFDDPESSDARLVAAFLARERERQGTLIAALRRDSALARWLTPQSIERVRGQVAVWDMLSLFAGYGGQVTRTVGNVPSASEPLDMTLAIDGHQATLDPWPFIDACVTLAVQARRVDRTWTDEAAMRDDLSRAPWETLTIALRPATGAASG